MAWCYGAGTRKETVQHIVGGGRSELLKEEVQLDAALLRQLLADPNWRHRACTGDLTDAQIRALWNGGHLVLWYELTLNRALYFRCLLHASGSQKEARVRSPPTCDHAHADALWVEALHEQEQAVYALWSEAEAECAQKLLLARSPVPPPVAPVVQPKASSSSSAQVVVKAAKSRVAPGGEGFECPASGCKSVFDTAKEALEHGATHGLLSGEREVDDEGKSCCLWQGCGKKFKVVYPSQPNEPNFNTLRRHEAEHVKGPEGFVCPECDEAYPTSAAAWACAATHDVEENPKKCLWAGCGLVFGKPSYYQAHEPVRVRRSCSAHSGVASRATPPATRLRCLSWPSLSRPPPRRVADAHGTLALLLHHVQQGPLAVRCATPPTQPLQRLLSPLACPWQGGRRSAARSPPLASAAGA